MWKIVALLVLKFSSFFFQQKIWRCSYLNRKHLFSFSFLYFSLCLFVRQSAIYCLLVMWMFCCLLWRNHLGPSVTGEPRVLMKKWFNHALSTSLQVCVLNACPLESFNPKMNCVLPQSFIYKRWKWIDRKMENRNSHSDWKSLEIMIWHSKPLTPIQLLHSCHQSRLTTHCFYACLDLWPCGRLATLWFVYWWSITVFFDRKNTRLEHIHHIGFEDTYIFSLAIIGILIDIKKLDHDN